MSDGCYRADPEVRRDAAVKPSPARRAEIMREARALRWPKKKPKGK